MLPVRVRASPTENNILFQKKIKAIEEYKKTLTKSLCSPMVERSLGKEEGTGSILVIGFYFFSVYLKLHKRKSIKKVSKESGYGEIGIRTRLRTWRFIHGGSSPSSRKQHLLKNISSLYLILRGRFENERSCASSLKLKRGGDKRCSTSRESPCLDL